VPALQGNALPFQMVYPVSTESKVVKADNKRLNRTGVIKFEKRMRLKKNHAEPGFERTDDAPELKEAASKKQPTTPEATTATLRCKDRRLNWKVLGILGKQIFFALKSRVSGCN
jgi:hypothetical protein